MKMRTLSLSAIALSLLLGSSAVLAERGGHGRGNDDRDDQRYEERDRHGDKRRDARDYRDDRRDDRRGDYREDRRYDRRDDRPRGGDVHVDFHFGDSHRRMVNDYYAPQFRSGRCPPGLAKKGNGCLPPGQARKWRRGYALPRDVAYYPLPHDLLVRLPIPPAGHEYVRVAGDILLIAIGSALVVDAIQDIGR
jgi:Ni/Co efflux regulator RcnB